MSTHTCTSVRRVLDLNTVSLYQLLKTPDLTHSGIIRHDKALRSSQNEVKEMERGKHYEKHPYYLLKHRNATSSMMDYDKCKLFTLSNKGTKFWTFS